MKKFIAIYHAAPEAMAQMTEATPEQLAEGMKYWMAWKDQVGDGIVDFGSPIMGGISMSPSGEISPSQKQVAGYSIVQAENAEAARAFFNGHPHLNWHPTATIEVHECADM